MKIGFATRDWSNWVEEGQPRETGGSGYYRCVLPARVLAEMGHEVVLGTLVAHNVQPELGVRTWDEENHWGFDVVVLQRWMFGDLPPKIQRARANGQIVLNDVDDWWEGLDPTNRAWMTSHPRYNHVENVDHYRHVLAAGDAIICSTPFLAERYRRLAPTVLIRNCLDLERWSVQEPRDGPPVLGWVGAIPWRSKGDLEALAGFLGSFVEKYDLRVRHAGAMAPGWDFALATKVAPWRLEQTPIVPISEHERQFEGIDIALVPLADKPFNHAKSGLKGMQAAAAGSAFVATQTPEYRWLQENRGIGLTAQRTHEWIRHLTRLLDPVCRARAVLENAGRVGGMGLPTLRSYWEVLLDALGAPKPTAADRLRAAGLVLPT